MGRRSRIQDSKETKFLDIILRLALLASLTVFLIVFTTSPKTNCDKCLFDYDGEKTPREFLNIYHEACINNSYGEKETFYKDIEDIQVNTTGGINNITFIK